ncbi:MAG: hypothetical protein Q9171_006836 [Xanthocarpia ochracea]
MDQTNWKKLYPVDPILIPSLKAGALSGASGLVVGGAAGIIRSSTPGLFAIASGLQCGALGTTFYGKQLEGSPTVVRSALPRTYLLEGILATISFYDWVKTKRLCVLCCVLIVFTTATRGAILQAWQVTASSPPQDRIYPSTLAGGLTGGTIGGLTRLQSPVTGGRANIIPGVIMFSLFGFAGQYLYNALDAQHQESLEPLAIHTAQSKSIMNADTEKMGTESTEPVEPLWKRVLNSKWSPMKVLSDEQYETLLRKKLLRVEAELAIVEDDIEKVKQRQNNAHQDGKES